VHSDSPNALYNQNNQFTQMSNGVTVTSLSASLQQKINAATDHLYQITSNQKLLHKFKKWGEFSSSVEANHAK
jgi:hypothetical protein